MIFLWIYIRGGPHQGTQKGPETGGACRTAGSSLPGFAQERDDSDGFLKGKKMTKVTRIRCQFLLGCEYVLYDPFFGVSKFEARWVR